jgi:hypothetical protein
MTERSAGVPAAQRRAAHLAQGEAGPDGDQRVRGPADGVAQAQHGQRERLLARRQRVAPHRRPGAGRDQPHLPAAAAVSARRSGRTVCKRAGSVARQACACCRRLARDDPPAWLYHRWLVNEHAQA